MMGGAFYHKIHARPRRRFYFDSSMQILIFLCDTFVIIYP